jgi:hypothetical protein
MTLCQCQVVMTKSHGGILVNVNYQLNKQYTFHRLNTIDNG